MTNTPIRLINISRIFIFLTLFLSLPPTSIHTKEPSDPEKSTQLARGLTVTVTNDDDDLDEAFRHIHWHESDKLPPSSLWEYTSSIATSIYNFLPSLPRPWSGGQK
ncbi:MAG: hypothetical protein K2Y18_04290 [Alphaproteobacteria bacterium]|jgi:hypothetical protein|nr:hypothetical protein [Alphaproteobacteria bacterium]